MKKYIKDGAKFLKEKWRELGEVEARQVPHANIPRNICRKMLHTNIITILIHMATLRIMFGRFNHFLFNMHLLLN